MSGSELVSQASVNWDAHDPAGNVAAAIKMNMYNAILPIQGLVHESQAILERFILLPPRAMYCAF